MTRPADAVAVQRVDPENYRIYTVVKYVTLLGIAAHAGFIFLFLSLGFPALAAFNIFSTAAWLVATWLNRHGRHWAAVNVLTIEVLLHAMFAVTVLGWSSGFQTYLMPTMTVLMFNHRLKTRWIIAEALALVAIYAGLYAWAKDYVPPGLSPGMLDAMHYINVGVVFTALCIVSYFFRDASISAEKRMEELATTDQLTGLANRRRMRERLEEERSRAERNGRVFSLVLTDVDHFKAVNDTWGHQRGDEVLRTVASVLRSTAREHDLVARWGGEEFLVLLPDSDSAAAVSASERMRAAVAAQRLLFDGREVGVTLTLGVATYDAPESVEETLKRADAALYRGKVRGRDRVETSASGPLSTHMTVDVSSRA